MMRFCWCTITVRDMEASLAFYRDIVGLPMVRRSMGSPGTELCFLGEGETQVELIYNPDREAPGNIEGISLGFTVPSLDEMMAFVREKGIPVLSGPHQPTPHIKFFYVKDPDGVTVQFVENL